MTGVTVSSEAFAGIDRHGGRVRPQVACGLLLGWRESDHYWVDRSLPCVNAADAASRVSRFVIDPGALLNVRRSLQGRPLSIVGFYYAPRDGSSEPTDLDRQFLRLWPETIWLIAGAPAAQVGRAWWLDRNGAAERELAVRAAAPRHAVVSCPG
jgi:proteasome lid subunit RPN8/RPN11